MENRVAPVFDPLDCEEPELVPPEPEMGGLVALFVPLTAPACVFDVPTTRGVPVAGDPGAEFDFLSSFGGMTFQYKIKSWIQTASTGLITC